MRKSIAVDMDGVIADIESHLLNWYEDAFGVRIPREELKGRSEADAFPDKQAIWRFVKTPGFFRSLPVMPGAVEAIQTLMADFEVYIVSAAMEFPLSLAEKYAWLQEHFPFIPWRNIIFCGDKSVIDTDYMIDDHCKNLDGCKGKAILFHSFHNVHLNHHVRVKSWAEVLALLQKEMAGGS
ncbi:MAG: 5' nucleotidase, NT5C type [Adhaeribacter sp.]